MKEGGRDGMINKGRGKGYEIGREGMYQHNSACF